MSEILKINVNKILENTKYLLKGILKYNKDEKQIC